MNRRDALKNTSLILGYSLSGSTLATILNSCQSEAGLDWTPVFFSKEQAATIESMTHIILPKTDTPGAEDLQLARFIDKMIHTVLSDEEKEHFLSGLQQFVQDCEAQYGSSFTELTEEQQTEILEKYDAETPPMTASIWGFSVEPVKSIPPFFRVLKELSLFGYFSSEEISKNILSYDPVPGTYNPCIPLNDVGNAWSE